MSDSEKKYLGSLYTAASALTFTIVLGLFLSQPTIPAIIADVPGGGGWAKAVHVTSNAYFLWLSTIAGIPVSLSAAQIVALNLLLALVGVVLLLRSAVPLYVAVRTALLIGTTLLLVLGNDAVVFQAIAVIPLCLWAAAAGSASPSIGRWVVLSLSAIALAMSAHQFALAAAIVVLFVRPAFTPATPATATARSTAIVALLLLAPAFVVTCLVPTPEIPEYPLLAHVVPDDNIPGHISALVGPSTALPILDRVALRDAFSTTSLVACALALLLWLIGGRSENTILRRSGLLLCALAAFDTVLPEEFSQISPLAALSRVVPGLFFVPLTPFVLALGVMVVLITASLRANTSRTILWAAVIALPGLIASFITNQHLPFSEALFAASLGQSPQQLAGTEVLQVTSLQPEARARLISPSFRLAKEYGGRPIYDAPRFQNFQFRSPSPAPAATVSGNPAEVHSLFDNDPGTRWTSGAHAQRGTEWIHLYFPDAQRIDGIELSTGNWRWDFPRGLEIRYSEACSQTPPPEPIVYAPIVRKNSWQGRVEFTADGYPYYGGQDLVQIAFAKTINAQCILIRQTETHPVFQWSVAEIRLLPPR